MLDAMFIVVNTHSLLSLQTFGSYKTGVKKFIHYFLLFLHTPVSAG